MPAAGLSLSLGNHTTATQSSGTINDKWEFDEPIQQDSMDSRGTSQALRVIAKELFEHLEDVSKVTNRLQSNIFWLAGGQYMDYHRVRNTVGDNKGGAVCVRFNTLEQGAMRDETAIAEGGESSGKPMWQFYDRSHDENEPKGRFLGPEKYEFYYWDDGSTTRTRVRVEASGKISSAPLGPLGACFGLVGRAASPEGPEHRYGASEASATSS